MKYTELKNSIAEGAKNIYLLEGDDAYFRMKGEEQILSAFLQMPELNFTSFDGETLKGNGITALVSAVKNYPFMAEKRIIKVSGFYPNENEYETYLKPLFEDFPPTSILLIVNVGGKKGVDLKRKYTVTYIDCNRADTDTVAKWAYITLRRAGVSVSTAACESIAEYCLCDMARVSSEVQKLIDYKGAEWTIEANPESTDSNFLSLIKSSPVSRVSLGVESFDDDVLKLLGRLHSAEKAEQAAEDILSTGKQLNIDMIYDIPYTDSKKSISTLNKII